MFRFAIEKPVVPTVAVMVLCLFGALAMFRVPIQMIPDLDARVVSVRTNWPGASPQDVEKEIVVEQEEYLRRIPGLDRIVSNANTGRAEIELEFPYGVELNEVLILVNNALAQVPSYPENVDEPRISATSFSSNAFMYFRVVPLPGNPQGVEIRSMQDFVEDYVRTRLERVRGVSEVRVYGGARRQINVYVDPVKLAKREIQLTDVRDAIRTRNRDVSGGDLDSGKRRYLLRTVGRFDDVEDIEKLIVARRGDAFIRLSDVGHARLARAELRNYAYGNGEAQINLSVRRRIGANVVEVMDDVLKAVERIGEELLAPRGLRMELVTEDVRYVKDAVTVVGQNLAIGAALATLVLFLFLRSLSATLIGAFGIPLCTVAAFLGLLVTGRTINVVSLAGVAFAIGMTLDNGIVVLENVYRHVGMGKPRRQAALDGVREVWPAVLASTLTTVFVFIPVIFVKEEAGQLYSDIAVAISASILMSMLVAIALVPAACSRFSRAPVARRRFGSAAGEWAMGRVAWLMRGTGRRLLTIMFTLLLMGAIVAWLTPRAEYLPEGEEKKIFAFMFAPPGYNVDTMKDVYARINPYFQPHIGADPELYESGGSAVPALDYTVGFVNPSRIMYLSEATRRHHADDLMNVVSRKIREIPGLIAFASRGSIFAGNLGGTRSINLDISGPALEPLFATGFDAFVKANEILDDPQVRPQPSSLTMGQPLLEIRPDWERAAEFGIDAGNLGYTVWAYSDGAYVDEFFLNDDKIDIFLYSTGGNIEKPQDIDNVMLYSTQGGAVPLGSVARVEETVNTETIRRVNGRRTVTLGIVPPRNVPLEEGVEIVERQLIGEMERSGRLPDGVHMTISGATDRLRATRQALSGNFLVAVSIAYLLMVAVFSHWGYPLVILATVPIGIGGGVAGLWLLNFAGAQLGLIGMDPIHQPFDMITMLGFLVLIGTVVNNPILIVERATTNLRKRGMNVADAVVESVHTRLRPILMSSITTIFGLSPLVFNPGAGTELYRGLGAIVLFGLLFSTLVTLFFMPSLLSLLLQWRHGRRAESMAPLSVAASPAEDGGT